MNKSDISNDSLSELRQGMKALKDNLLGNNLVTDKEMRLAMRDKSLWLNHVVVAEFIILPFIVFFLFSLALSTGMNIWLPIIFTIAAFADAGIDMRTFAVSKRWILDDSLAELSRKLARQKLERLMQTVISSMLVVLWGVWFVYEYVKHVMSAVTEEHFTSVWWIVSVIYVVIALAVVCVIYRKAQRTNDEMIKRLNSFSEE